MTPPDNQFIHRPISITVEGVREMETVRTLPAAETRVTVNAKLDQAMAKALLLLLAQKVLADEPLDVVTFSLDGTLK